MNEDLKRNVFYEETWYDLKQMSEGCKECAYRADETHCGLYCRFLDVQGQCRCFHKEGEPFVSRKIEREMSDIEKRLLRAQTPDFKEVRMIWLNNIWLIEDPLLYNVHDMGNVFGFEFHETEMFLLKHIKKQDFLQMLVPRRDNGPRDFYMTADGVRRMALVGFEKAEAEDRMRFFSNDWKWISRTYFKWMPQMAKRFFGGLSLLNV
ncbi:hypothetical protein [Eubacterium limosum]|uniref:hypothetical protein n=1 Tax=Eubacterium limosum TaxID=1736 RepID=UPI00371A0906